MRYLRTVVWGILLVVLSLSLDSCTGGGSRGVPFWNAMGGPLGDALRKIIRDYNRKYPGDPVVYVNLGSYSTLSQKIMGAVAANKPPVLAQVYESWTSELLQANKIVPFGDLMRKWIPDSVVKDIFPVFLEDNTWDGRMLTFPFNKSVPVFYYNIDLFEKYGIDHFPETWEEFREVAKKLTVDTTGDGVPDIYGTAYPVNVWLYEIILYQKGGRIIDKGHVAFDSPEGIEALKYLVDLIYRDSCAYLTTGFRHQDDFATGRVAMVFGTIVSYAFMKPKINFRLGVAPMPHDRDSIVIISGTNVAIFRGHPQEKIDRAFDFIRYFLNDSVQVYWSTHTGYLPLRRSILDLPEMKKFMAQVPGFERAIRQVEYATYEPRDPVWFTGRRYLTTEGLEPALRGYLPPEVSLKRAARLLETELRRRR